MQAEKRRAPPLHVKLESALRQLVDAWKDLGRLPRDSEPQLEFDHVPPLALRDVDPETGHHIPHQHDSEHLQWMVKEDHARKTRGSGATTAGSDIGEIRKTRQLVKKRRAREAKAAGEPPPARTKPKAKIPSPPKKARPKQLRASGFKRRGV